MKLQGPNCLQNRSNLHCSVALHLLSGHRENIWEPENKLEDKVYSRRRMLQSMCLIIIIKRNCYMYVLTVVVQFISVTILTVKRE